MAKRTSRVASGLAAVLAGSLLVGGLLLSLRLRPYWVARHCGREADLHGAWLTFAPLRRADLTSANLRSAALGSANLVHADLTGADLRSAGLRAADLRGAVLTGTDLSKADLCDADLRYAVWIGQVLIRNSAWRTAKLCRADLRGADLRNGYLFGVDVKEARYDSRTRWPSGFDPQRRGAVRME
jgi:uncharacterized protein YjbI with pentapeptide repeats